VKPEAVREDARRALWPAEGSAPKHVLACRGCGRRNRIGVDDGMLFPERCACGGCGKPLFLGASEPLLELASAAYEHPLDRASLEVLRAVPGFPAALRFLISQGSERASRLLFLSDMVRCGPDQLPEVAAVLERARASLDLDARPTLFLGESPVMNAFASGVRERAVVLQAALLDQLDDDELCAVLGHELGHIHADHGLYRSLADILLRTGALAAGLGALVTAPLRAAVLKWWRAAELTCDRAGLLASRDLAASLALMLKMAGGGRPGTSRRSGLRLSAFVAQARELEEVESASVLDAIASALNALDATHPFVAWRILHLVKWVESGAPLDILAGHYPRAPRERAPACPAPTTSRAPA
jgi:Zn-dependent protease with chaperone function